MGGGGCRGHGREPELVAGKVAIAPHKLVGRQAGWGMHVRVRNRVLKRSPSREGKLAKHQPILLSIYHKSLRKTSS